MVATDIERGGTFRNLANIFAAPSEAFRALKERPTSLLPLLVLIAGACIVILWYYSSVDIPWLVERSLDQAGAQLPADARRQLLDRIAKTSPYVMGGSAAVASVIVMLLLLLVSSGYLTLVSQVTDDGYRFKSWFSLVCWSSMPYLLSLLATAVNLAANDVSHLPAEQLNPLSFANLLGLHLSGGTLVRVLQSLDLTSFWALGLMIAGYHRWTGKGLGASAAIVAGPLLVLVAAILLIAL